MGKDEDEDDDADADDDKEDDEDVAIGERKECILDREKSSCSARFEHFGGGVLGVAKVDDLVQKLLSDVRIRRGF